MGMGWRDMGSCILHLFRLYANTGRTLFENPEYGTEDDVDEWFG